MNSTDYKIATITAGQVEDIDALASHIKSDNSKDVILIAYEKK